VKFQIALTIATKYPEGFGQNGYQYGIIDATCRGVGALVL